MSKAIPVTFFNKEGLRLFGILQGPGSVCNSQVAIILLSPGVKTRVAPHRLYNKMAERFMTLGYPVLRFDFYGLGDSEGEVQEDYLADLYGSIQVGRYVGDTVAAMDWMQQTYGVSQFIVSGLCGGALTGLLTASRDSRIICLLGLSIPVILDGTNLDSSRYMTEAQLERMGDRYIRKLANISAWYSWFRFFTFQSDYRLIVRSLVEPLLKRLKKKWLQSDSQRKSGDNTNPYFAPSFFRMVTSSRHVFLVFGEMDRLYWEIEKKFVERNQAELKSYVSFYDVRLIKSANHIFSFEDWEKDMLNQCSSWLCRLGDNKGAMAVVPE
jgi:uncharacterized protein